jgi:glucokinase
MILAGDIGGTKVVLALFSGKSGQWEPSHMDVFNSREHPSLLAIVEQYLTRHQIRPSTITRGVFGIAGPVKEGICHTTNLPWVVEEAKISPRLEGAPVTLLNDLVANAWGIEALQHDQFATLQAGEAHPTGSRALISAGTGLGLAGLLHVEGHFLPIPSEGGHADFSPRTDLDLELFQYFRQRFDGVVDWERVLCGHALVDIYEFLRERAGARTPAWLADQMRVGDPAAAISTAGVEGRDPVCQDTVNLFVEYYGAAAGNAALTFLALGGVYIGGGIAPKILPKLRDSRFLKSFLDKGRMRPLLESMPVHVILNPHTALLGAAVCATRLSPGRG